MLLKRPASLADYTEQLASAGRITFSREEAMRALSTNHGAFLDAASRLVRRGHIFAPRRGFYVIVPTQFLRWGAPPPGWYIAAMMKHAGRPYYVGLLKAAELHGAAHQAVMEYQVVMDRQWKPIRAGRSLISFHYRKDMGTVEQGVEQRKTEASTIRVACKELTALDLIRYPKASAGLDHAATVLGELGPELDTERLAQLASAFERSVVQRLGYIIDTLGFEQAAARLEQFLKSSPLPWVELDPQESSMSVFSEEPLRDRRWRMIVRRQIQIDEQ